MHFEFLFGGKTERKHEVEKVGVWRSGRNLGRENIIKMYLMKKLKKKECLKSK